MSIHAIKQATSKSLEEENLELKEKNNALVQKVQHWKMLAAQKEEEKIDLMRELNQMRLTLSHYRSSSSAMDSVLDSTIQEFGEETLTRLVEVSNSITKTVEVMKNYLHKKQEIEEMSQNGKMSIQDSPRDRSSNKVLRVFPMIAGRSIGNPIILLRPIDQAAHGARQGEGDGSPREQVPSPQRHSLQDLYIPLRRIDTETLNTLNVRRGSQLVNAMNENNDIADASFEDAELNLEGAELVPENADEVNDENLAENSQDELSNRREMETVVEETEDENWSPQVMLSRDLPINKRKAENPLEGPSWLLDRLDHIALDRLYSDIASPAASKKSVTKRKTIKRSTGAAGTGGAGVGVSLEPDSTTDTSQTETSLRDGCPVATSSPQLMPQIPQQADPDSPTVHHTPTRRRRRRRSCLLPRLSLALVDNCAATGDTAAANRDLSMNKDPTKALVIVAKMKVNDLWNGVRSHSTPPCNRARVPLDAPSPNGSTRDAGLIVMESPQKMQPVAGPSDAIQQAEQIDNRQDTQNINDRPRNKSNESNNSHSEVKTDDRNVTKPAQKRSKNSARQESLPGRISVRRSNKTENSDDSSSRQISSDDSETETGTEAERPKRPRRAPPSYKEKPLNRKLRR